MIPVPLEILFGLLEQGHFPAAQDILPIVRKYFEQEPEPIVETVPSVNADSADVGDETLAS